MRISIIFSLVLIASLSFADTSVYDEKNNFTFPPKIDDFKLIKKETYEDPGLGYSIVYGSEEGIWISVIVYNLGISHIGTGTNNPLVKGQFDHAIADIKTAVEHGFYNNVELSESSKILSDNFLAKTFIITNRTGIKNRSHILIRGQNRHFIKIRATGPNNSLIDIPVANFVSKIEDIIGSNSQIHPTKEPGG